MGPGPVDGGVEHSRVAAQGEKTERGDHRGRPQPAPDPVERKRGRRHGQRAGADDRQGVGGPIVVTGPAPERQGRSPARIRLSRITIAPPPGTLLDRNGRQQVVDTLFTTPQV
jgi:hypothetical protein